MKRAWPYAVALAVVVTGCYLALAPLLRSISPSAPSSAGASLATSSGTTTVGLAPIPTTTSRHNGTTVNFTNLLKLRQEQRKAALKRAALKRAAARKAAARKAAARKAAARAAARRRAAQQSQQTFISNSAKSDTSTPSVSTSPTRTTPTTSSSTPVSTKPAAPKTTTAKTTQRTASVGGGQVDQADNAGLAGHDKGESSVSGGTSGSIAN